MSRIGTTNGIKKGVEVQTDTQDARGEHQRNCGTSPKKPSGYTPCLRMDTYLAQVFP